MLCWNGCSLQDVHQGSLGDCWLMAALSALSDHPQKLKSLFGSRHLTEDPKFSWSGFCDHVGRHFVVNLGNDRNKMKQWCFSSGLELSVLRCSSWGRQIWSIPLWPWERWATCQHKSGLTPWLESKSSPIATYSIYMYLSFSIPNFKRICFGFTMLYYFSMLSC